MADENRIKRKILTRHRNMQHVTIYRQEMIGGNHDAVRLHECPTQAQLLRLRRHDAANVTPIDEQVGRILEAPVPSRSLLGRAV